MPAQIADRAGVEAGVAGAVGIVCWSKVGAVYDVGAVMSTAASRVSAGAPQAAARLVPDAGLQARQAR